MILVCFMAAGFSAAQDWRNDERTDTRYDCDVIDAIIADFGDELLHKFNDDSTSTLGEFLTPLFARCLEPADEDGAAESASPEDGVVAADTDESEADAEADGEIETVVLENDKIHALDEEGCVVAVDTRFEEDFNLSITGHGQDGLVVEIFPPGESDALVMDDSEEYTVEIGEELPVRIEWATGDDFPLGVYTFVVTIDDNSYRFEWDRQDPAYRTFVLTCYRPDRAEDGESDPGLLEDNDTRVIADSECFIKTEAWDEDFNVVIIGEPQDGISVSVYFPGEIRAEAMDDVFRDEFDDGTPYRVEWIEGRFFPLGLYNIEVTIEDEVYAYKWQREGSEINTIEVECIGDDDS